MINDINWVPTPTFLYRNYLYEKILKNISNNKRFLLIGTGSGYFLKRLQNMGFKGLAIDISIDSVSLVKKIVDLKKIKVKEGDILNYKNSKKFDLVLAFEVLEHIKDDEMAIKNIYKLLNDRGQFIFSVPAHMSKWGEVDDMGGHYRRYERNNLAKLLRGANFKIEKTWTYGFPVLSIVQSISKSGIFVKNFNTKISKRSKTKCSGIRTDYNPGLSFLFANTILLMPLFLVMNLFLNSDLGFGYIVVARK